MAETEQEKQWYRELEAAGEQAVRDSLNFDRGIATGGGDKLQYVSRWLREKEQERELRLAVRIAVATFIVGVLTFLASIAAVIVPYFVHP